MTCGLLTAPDRNAPVLQLADYGAHGHSAGNGIEERRVWGHGEDGNFRARRPLPFHLDPVKTSTEPHGSQEHSYTHVHESDEGHRQTSDEKCV